jgi:HAD superfamily hydrolase (TIGR01509 family)
MLAYMYSYIWQPVQVDPIPALKNDKAIIFDLDGVVLTTDSLQAFQEIGITTILQYIATEWKLPSQATLFNALETTPAVSTFDSYNQGIRMPQIMVDWQCASQSLVAIQLAMNRQIRNSQKSDLEKNVLLQTISMMLTPKKFIATRKNIPAGVELLHELKAQGYKLFVLSNWDPTSFSLLKAKHPEIFMYQGGEMFDGIMISGNVGILKPERAIFEKCLTDFNLQASDAIFIDDTIENVQAAQQMGITAIQCDPHNISTVRKQLIDILKK